MRPKHWFYTIPLRLRSLFRRRQVEQELDDEIRYHIDRQIEENIAKGMTPEEARYAALRAMGGIERRKEECRDTRHVRLIEELMQDLRYGLRTLRKSPGFTAVAALSLALGIGANTAIFSVFDPIVIRPLPVKNPEQLVTLHILTQRGEEYPWFSYPMFERLRSRTQIFSGVIAAEKMEPVDVVGPESGNQKEKGRLQLVSGEYFQVLGVNAVPGRTFTTADDNQPAVATLSYRYWQRRFGGDVSIIGKVITLQNHPFTVIGVTAPEFLGTKLGEEPDIWAPLTALNILGRDLSENDKQVMARLRPDVREEQVQAALSLYLEQIKSEMSDLDKQIGWMTKIAHYPGRQGFRNGLTWLSQPLYILLAGVGLTLLIACANVANLLLARAARRAPEVAIRLTIGAGRFRLIRQFLAESALLAAAGAALGLLFAWWGCAVILALISEYDSSIDISSIGVITNARALGFTIAVSFLTTLLFGLAPALIATRQGINTALKAPAPSHPRRSRISFSRCLVIAQVSLSLLLLTGAGLFTQTLRNLRSRAGFAAEQVIQGSINLQESGYKREQAPDLYQRIVERLNSTPGVQSATIGGWWWLVRKSEACCIAIEGYIHRPDEDRYVQTKRVGPGYFQTLGLPLLGREFTPQELNSGPERDAKVAIINETMARQYFGAGNPLGKRFGWGDPQFGTASPWAWRFEQGNPLQFEIIGVAKDAVYDNPRHKIPPLIYFPSQDRFGFMARATGPGSSLEATIRREIQIVDKNIVADIQTVSQMLDEYLFTEKLLVKFLGFFSLLALLLACVGLYGVMSYDVARRTHEIGVRMALGAQRRDVVGIVMRETMLLVVIGVVIGLGAAMGATRLIASLLYGLTPNDPLTIALAGLSLLAVAALAAYLPARRASRVDPMVALRHD